MEMAGGCHSTAIPSLSSVTLCCPQSSVNNVGCVSFPKDAPMPSVPDQPKNPSAANLKQEEEAVKTTLCLFTMQRRCAYLVPSASTATGSEPPAYRHYTELSKLTIWMATIFSAVLLWHLPTRSGIEKHKCSWRSVPIWTNWLVSI